MPSLFRLITSRADLQKSGNNTGSSGNPRGFACREGPFFMALPCTRLLLSPEPGFAGPMPGTNCLPHVLEFS